QAEDGIRDFHVTGVQTCALPIYQDLRVQGPPARRPPPRLFTTFHPRTVPHGVAFAAGRTRCSRCCCLRSPLPCPWSSRTRAASRSEERRVGKGGSSRWRPVVEVR